MKMNNYTLNDVKHIVNVLENHSHTRDYQALEEILPLVLVILKSQIRKTYLSEGPNKFYAPIWVDTLLERLSKDEHPLSNDEYQAFRTDVEKLSINDYKIAEDELFGYIPVFTSIEEITEVILALKHYFGFL